MDHETTREERMKTGSIARGLLWVLTAWLVGVSAQAKPILPHAQDTIIGE